MLDVNDVINSYVISYDGKRKLINGLCLFIFCMRLYMGMTKEQVTKKFSYIISRYELYGNHSDELIEIVERVFSLPKVMALGLEKEENYNVRNVNEIARRCYTEYVCKSL